MRDHKGKVHTPHQNPTRREVEQLRKARMSLGHLLNDTQPLQSQDYELIGTFIQTYCIADLEARRMINCLSHINSGKPTTFALKLNDTDVLSHLLASADSCVWNLDLAAGIRKAAEIFVQHRHLRHMFSHWAGRRIPDHESLILFTSSFGSQKAPKGVVKFEEHEDANIQYAIVPISNLIDELVKLKGHAQYLAKIGAQLEVKAPEIAKRLSLQAADKTSSI